MFDREALELIQKTAVAAEGPRELDTPMPAVVLPDGANITTTEHLQDGRARFRGMYQTNTLAEFISYTKARTAGPPLEYGPARVFVNAEDGSAAAFFNLGQPGASGHADDRGQLKLRQTAAYASLLGFAGKQQSQRAVAEWLEDWFEFVTPIYPGDGTTTAPSLTAAIAAIRDITVTAKGESNSVQSDMSAARSSMEEVEAKSRKSLPSGFRFAAAPYDGFLQRTFELRLAVLPRDKEPLLTLRIVGLGDVQERIGQEFEQKVRTDLDGVSVHRGTFTP